MLRTHPLATPNLLRRWPAWLLAALLTASAAVARPTPDEDEDWILPIVGGTVKLDVRARYEHADIDHFEPSNAATVRTRLGYGTQPWEGLSAFIEMENIAAADTDAYYDGIPPNRRSKSVIADPTDTEVNQAFAQIERSDFGKTLVKGGRQRIVFDDQRFIGNVGWRQNEQTYDSVYAQTALGIDGLSLGYGYILDVRRIFGDQGPRATQDYDSNSHLARVAYDVAPWFQPVAFAYLLDLRQSPSDSSNSFGLRATGNVPLADDWFVAYQGSYAWQTDGGTSGGTNPVNYTAHYMLAELSLAFLPIGAVGGGYELLGSDGGRARFVTPLATLHKFNGWADVFLNNGGVNGLQDAYAFVSPKLPWQLKGSVIYHKFQSHHNNRDLGHEVDAILSRAFGKHVTVLTKMAWYDDGGRFSPADTTRYWVEATLAF